MADQEYRDLAEQVAPLLGPGWKQEPPSHYVGAILLGPHGERLQLRDHEGNHKRVAVYGRYPRTDMAAPNAHGISIALARGSAVIAADITRRMLAAYQSDLARVVEYNRDQEQKRERRTYNAGELAKLLPGATVDHNNHAGTRVHWYKPYALDGVPTEISAELSVDGQTVYTLELRGVPVGLAGLLLDLAATPPQRV